jgi:hypothetical protein
MSTHQLFTLAKIIILFFAIIFVLPVQAQTGVYTLNGGTASQANQTYAATLTDQSAVYVFNSGHLTLTNCTMTKTGDASNVNNSSQYGTNAGVLAKSAGIVVISGGSVTTNALGANGLFATGTGSSVSMSDGTINASGSSAHGVDATYGGSISLTNVNVTSTGANSSVLATDFGGGTVTVSGGTIIASATEANSHSAGIYSTGNITVTGATVISSGDCGGVIDGANTINLINTSLAGKLEGIKLWNTTPASGSATVTINGGSLTATTGNAFYVTGEAGNTANGIITLSGGAVINAGTGNIIKAVSPSTVNFTADNESLTGNMITSGNSTITAMLKNNTTLTGRINVAALSIDSTSSWTLTGNSILTTLIDPSGISGLLVTNITGNGYSVHYDSSLTGNEYLGGLTYSLVNGGVLTPEAINSIEEHQSVASTDWILYQNYPNPFRSTTTISFELFKPAYVTLKIYDILGNQIKVLFNKMGNIGKYAIPFAVNGLGNGIYYYQLNVDGAIQTQKMIIQK